jgi:Stage II sporulation protein E (SpoIIE)
MPPMTNSPVEHMPCMEVWGGSQLTSRCVVLGGLDAWVYSKPHGKSRCGGDVYYASSCAAGRITRLLLADVAGHGTPVAAIAADLRTLMRRFVNRWDQAEFVRLLNQHSRSSPGRKRLPPRSSARFLSHPKADPMQRGTSACAPLPGFARRMEPAGA